MFSNICVLTVIIFGVMLFIQIIIDILFSVFNIFNKVFFNNSVKLYGFTFEHVTTFLIRQYTSFQKHFNSSMYFFHFWLCKMLEILQVFQYTKIYEVMGNVDIALFYKICVVAAMITMRLLILEIFVWR